MTTRCYGNTLRTVPIKDLCEMQMSLRHHNVDFQRFYEVKCEINRRGLMCWTCSESYENLGGDAALRHTPCFSCRGKEPILAQGLTHK